MLNINISKNMETVIKENSENDIAVLLTEQCNFECIMCPQHIVTERDDKTEYCRSILSKHVNVNTENIGITGGEPTILGGRLVSFIEYCKNNYNNINIDLLTNGMLLNDLQYAKKIAIAANEDITFCVPIYGDNSTLHDEITGAKSFYKVIQGIHNLGLLEQKIEIRILIMKNNYSRLTKIAEFLYRNMPFVCHIVFMSLEMKEKAWKNAKEIWIPPGEYMKYLEDAVFHLVLRSMNVSIYNIPLCVLPGWLHKYSRKSISTWKRAYVNVCNKCGKKPECGGMFDSTIEYYRNDIKEIT